MDDKTALKSSRAGMRLIAQTAVFNNGDTGRLQAYIQDNYSPDALAQQPPEARLQQFEHLQQQAGKLRVQQVMATSDYHVVVMLGGQHDAGDYFSEVKVEEEYPHKITAFTIRKMTAAG